MSKKKLLIKKVYYSIDHPEDFSEQQSFKIKGVQRGFSEVLKILEEKRYLFFTKDGYYHLLPKGLFMHKAIISRAEEIMKSEDFVQYKFASIFSSTVENKVSFLIEKFADQVFKVTAENNETKYLKYASDPLIFDYFSNKEVQIPTKIYSPDYFYRVIQNGELKPLVQPREFYMTDFHYFAEFDDFDSFVEMAYLNKKAVESFISEDDWYLNIDTNLEFFNSHKKEILKMLKRLSSNSVINITSEKTHYYSIQNQYMVNYFFGNKMQLANLQFDQKNGEVFNIRSSKTKKGISVIHGTIYGRSEKVLALIFGKQVETFNINGTKPILPLWLSPIIVRIIPLEDTNKIGKYTSTLKTSLKLVNCRFDIDVRNISFRDKVKSAERDWIPFQILIGDKEVDSNTISIRDRYEDKSYTSTIEGFIGKIKRLSKGQKFQEQTTSTIFNGEAFY